MSPRTTATTALGPRVIGLAGSFSVPSKTRALVDFAANKTALAYGGTASSYDLLDIGPSLGAATHLDALDPLARAIVENIVTADLLIVGTPVYKGSYTGLFKHLIDLLSPTALTGKPILLLATGGGDRHALVVEHQLRPLFGFFESAVLPTGIYAGPNDFTAGLPTAPALLERLDRAIGQFTPHLPQARALAAE